MNTIKALSFCLICAVAFGAAGCGGEDVDHRYDPVKDLMTDQIKLFKNTTSALNKAESAEDIADALNQWADGMRALFPRFKENTEILSQLKEMDPPIELQASNRELDMAGKAMNEASAKIQQFMDDPKVQSAQQNVAKMLEELQEIDPSLR